MHNKKNKTFYLFCFLVFCFISRAACAQNVTVIGVGKLGLCLALSMENAGYHVLGVDISESYVSSLNCKTFSSSEPGLNDYLMKSKNFKATTSLKEGLAFSDIYFLVVATAVGTHSYDCRTLSALLAEINSYELQNKHFVICSTLEPGYIANTAKQLLKDCEDVSINYNPLFIAQGDIFNGLREPDIVLIGADSDKAHDAIESIYKKVCFNAPYFARMNVASAEITKLALNCFLTTKIALANLIGDIADATPKADKIAILNTIGKDQRIGPKYISPGYGFGGSCFPRDNRTLGNYAASLGLDPVILRATDEANDQHAIFLAQNLMALNQDVYVFEDVSYKPNSPVALIENSQKLIVAKLLAKHGEKVIIRDRPEVVSLVQEQFGDLFEYEQLQTSQFPK